VGHFTKLVRQLLHDHDDDDDDDDDGRINFNMAYSPKTARTRNS